MKRRKFELVAHSGRANTGVVPPARERGLGVLDETFGRKAMQNGETEIVWTKGGCWLQQSVDGILRRSDFGRQELNGLANFCKEHRIPITVLSSNGRYATYADGRCKWK